MYVAVTLDEAEEIHARLATRFGVMPGVRDRNQLDACLQTPVNEFSWGPAYATLGCAAGALLHGLIQSHPFVDGNKRAAVVILAYFLNKNGYDVTFTPNTMREIANRIATGEITRESVCSLLESNVCAIPLREDDGLHPLTGVEE